jgi:hypothetical protein
MHSTNQSVVVVVVVVVVVGGVVHDSVAPMAKLGPLGQQAQSALVLRATQGSRQTSRAASVAMQSLQVKTALVTLAARITELVVRLEGAITAIRALQHQLRPTMGLQLASHFRTAAMTQQEAPITEQAARPAVAR